MENCGGKDPMCLLDSSESFWPSWKADKKLKLSNFIFINFSKSLPSKWASYSMALCYKVCRESYRLKENSLLKSKWLSKVILHCPLLFVLSPLIRTDSRAITYPAKFGRIFNRKFSIKFNEYCLSISTIGRASEQAFGWAIGRGIYDEHFLHQLSPTSWIRQFFWSSRVCRLFTSKLSTSWVAFDKLQN